MNALNTNDPINMNAATMNNLLTFSNNYIHYLNNSVNYLNNSITYLNNVMYMNNYYINNANASNANVISNTNVASNTNVTSTNENNAHLFNYDFDDFIKLSNTNIYALIKSNTIDLYYGNIENPTNDSCAITHEKFSNCDDVTMIKECGHIFNSGAIKQWLIQHQTCPNCRHNILSNSNIISYSDPDNNNKTVFLYTNEFKFYLALHIERLLSNGLANNEDEVHIIV
uniref:RING-type domain-containing protein n=1 Tax=viral metagenome TaxID=1070528 RepID=A0A6C0KNR5_9ZZZZ